jgi:hypothetical protein
MASHHVCSKSVTTGYEYGKTIMQVRPWPNCAWALGPSACLASHLQVSSTVACLIMGDAVLVTDPYTKKVLLDITLELPLLLFVHATCPVRLQGGKQCDCEAATFPTECRTA